MKTQPAAVGIDLESLRPNRLAAFICLTRAYGNPLFQSWWNVSVTFFT